MTNIGKANNIILELSDGYLSSLDYSIYIVEALSKMIHLQKLDAIYLTLKSEIIVGNRNSTPNIIKFNKDFTEVKIDLYFAQYSVTPSKNTSPPTVASVISSLQRQFEKAANDYEAFLEEKSIDSKLGDSKAKIDNNGKGTKDVGDNFDIDQSAT